MIDPPRGLSGEPGRPITIRAENDGGVLIDGGSRVGSRIKAPVRLKNNDHFVLEGFDAANSNTAVVSVGGTWDRKAIREGVAPEHWKPIRGVVLRRIVAWDANPRFADYHRCRRDPECSPDRKGGWNANFHVFDIAAADGVLLEDVAGFGTGRKTFQVFLSRDVTIRRAWGRWGGNGATHTQTFSCAYRSYDSLCENLLATWSGQQQDDAIEIKGQLKTILGMDWFKTTDSFQGRDPFDSRLRVLGSLAYLRADAKLVPKHMVVFGYGKNVRVEDVVAVSAGAGPSRTTVTLTGCTDRVSCKWAGDADRTRAPLVARNVVGLGDHARVRVVLHPDWKRAAGSETVRAGSSADEKLPSAFGGEHASLCHRYVDGTRTSEPLWPWPMNERIRIATGYARGVATDVEQEVQALLGPIPAACIVGGRTSGDIEQVTGTPSESTAASHREPSP